MIGHSADYIPPHTRALYDKNVSFEEYHFYAQACRREEAANAGAAANKPTSFWDAIIPGRGKKHADELPSESEMPAVNVNKQEGRMHISDEEWVNASRALRLATWGSMFYLITTDILGPFALPFAIATTGWGPGIALYTVFGVLAGYSGYLIWRMFLGLDSYQYPMRTFGDLGFRIYGPWARYGINILQSIQLLCNVGVLVIQNGQSLSQVAKFRLCYAVCCLVWALVGFAVGQVRTLKNYGWLANSAIWLNILTIFFTMGVAANTAPNYSAATSQSAGSSISGVNGTLVAQLPDGSWPKVQTSGALPNSGNFTAAITGLMQAVYSYGGAMVFIEFMSEMRRPYDFIKAMWGAQAFIYFFYMFYGCFLYGYQGQYVINPSYQGLSPYHWQIVANVLNMVASIIAAGLYGNIGIKVLYNTIFAELLNAPPLTTRTGKLLWAGLVPVYWSLAFIIAAAIPNFTGLTSVVAAFCILHFTYSFPPILYLGYKIKRDTLRNLGLAPMTNHSRPGHPNEQPTSSTGADSPPAYDDEKKDLKTADAVGPQSNGHHHVFFRPSTHITSDARKAALKKTLVKGLPILVWLMIYFLGALVTSGLGAYSAIETLIDAFKSGSATSFTCHSPLDA
ncbi:hypothetical protein K461DRAFT_286439 [Myriangium duriaei CBS 260.36]|uniref:Amino acid transporter transmembrane domain-containing protein n=1 Tax=Myriangium duriaei CBS 260.36 TaxID=1168546 RepID=A0A9P4J530_9PEZI|nr:hypothetical protein K461DRAFT_286439 [Myriangium duriaei CBS 260.36]